MTRCHLRIAAAAAMFAMLSAGGAFAGQVTVSGGWFRALPAGLPAGGYFTLHNGRDEPVTLKAADSPACGMLMIHRSVHTSGMEHMMPAGDLDVPPGGTLVFAPGGLHLMCMQPTAGMKPGASVVVTLEFADGSTVVSDFAVRSANGS